VIIINPLVKTLKEQNAGR